MGNNIQIITIFDIQHKYLSKLSVIYARAVLTDRYSETLLQRLLSHTRIAAINDSTSDSIYIRRYIGTITVTGL